MHSHIHSQIEQPFKRRGILNDELYEARMNAYTFKDRGVDPQAMDAKTSPEQQAFQGRAAGGDDGVQRALRDLDLHECKLLEQGKLKRLHSIVREMALADGGGLESGREAEDGRRWWLQQL